MWQIRESLKRLGIEYVDIYHAQLYDPETPKWEVMTAFNDLVRMGLTRYIGISNIPAQELVEYVMIAENLGLEPIAVLQYKYNLLEREIEKDIIPIAKKIGMGLAVYSLLAQGVLAGRYVDIKDRKWIVPILSRAIYYEGVWRYFTDEKLKKILHLIEFQRLREHPLTDSYSVGDQNVQEL
mgnify:CR=1 FL=1